MDYRFDHENLDVYKLALEVARSCAVLRIPTGRTHLRDQLQRAADSVVLNIAEGRARGGDAGRNLIPPRCRGTEQGLLQPHRRGIGGRSMRRPRSGRFAGGSRRAAETP